MLKDNIKKKIFRKRKFRNIIWLQGFIRKKILPRLKMIRILNFAMNDARKYLSGQNNDNYLLKRRKRFLDSIRNVEQINKNSQRVHSSINLERIMSKSMKSSTRKKKRDSLDNVVEAVYNPRGSPNFTINVSSFQVGKREL